MLTHKLDPTDLNHEKMSKFDGTMVYAQNKRQQVITFIKNLMHLLRSFFLKVVLSEIYARNHPNVYFATMHPGWSDTPGITQKYDF
jgi:dehydrogenase/reductase SDR family protein 12